LKQYHSYQEVEKNKKLQKTVESLTTELENAKQLLEQELKAKHQEIQVKEQKEEQKEEEQIKNNLVEVDVNNINKQEEEKIENDLVEVNLQYITTQQKKLKQQQLDYLYSKTLNTDNKTLYDILQQIKTQHNHNMQIINQKEKQALTVDINQLNQNKDYNDAKIAIHQQVFQILQKQESAMNNYKEQDKFTNDCCAAISFIEYNKKNINLAYVKLYELLQISPETLLEVLSDQQYRSADLIQRHVLSRLKNQQKQPSLFSGWFS
jgi:hypothetical protein